MLNSGYEPKRIEEEKSFSNGELVNKYWSKRKNRIINKLNEDTKYEVGYERAKLIASVYKDKTRREENKENIKELCKYHNIDINNNKSLLKKSCNEVYAKICYLIDNNISICDNKGIVHELFFMSDINMQAKYNISFKELIEKYVYDSNKFRSV